MTRALLAVLALCIGCGVDARSTDFECSLPSDCTGNRMCVDGWCVLEGTDQDGGGTGSDAAVACDAACTRCEGSICVIECSGANSCAAEIVCPAGLDCRVECAGNDSCAGGIDCGTERCDVICSGDDSCTGGVDCSSACACDTDCSGNGSCDPEPSCPSSGPCQSGGDCRSGPGSCDSC